jgi:hypothetical protein
MLHAALYNSTSAKQGMQPCTTAPAQSSANDPTLNTSLKPGESQQQPQQQQTLHQQQQNAHTALQ